MPDRPPLRANTTATLLNLLAGVFSLSCVASEASAATLDVDITLPAIPSAAYHYPYLAAWIEKADDQSAVGTLTVWYDQRLRDGLGKLFLHNLRSWWRKTGAATALPTDGISGATRGPGVQALHFNDSQGVLAHLPAGQYVLAVEAAREQGGRSVLRTPFTWGGSGSSGAGSSVANSSNGGGDAAELVSLKTTVSP